MKRPFLKNLLYVLGMWPLTYLTAVLAGVVTSVIALCFGVELPPQSTADDLIGLHGWKLAKGLALSLVVAPLWEESVFRGLFFHLPLKWLPRGVIPFAVLSSALFSAAHYIQGPWPDIAFVSIFFIGLIQCRIYRKTGRIWCVMLNHALVNLVACVLTFVAPDSLLAMLGGEDAAVESAVVGAVQEQVGAMDEFTAKYDIGGCTNFVLAAATNGVREGSVDLLLKDKATGDGEKLACTFTYRPKDGELALDLKVPSEALELPSVKKDGLGAEKRKGKK